MKKVFGILTMAAVLLLAAACGKCDQPASKGALDVIKARTSIRSFTGDKLTEEQINTLLDAAMAAPTAGNMQPWRFVVVTGDEAKAALFEGDRRADMYTQAGAVIFVCGETTALRRPHGQPDAEPVLMPNDFWYEDCSAATENLLLAATAVDLGAVWISCYPNERKVKKMQEALGLPDNVVPLAIVPVGVPAENPEPKVKWDPEKVHYDRW